MPILTAIELNPLDPLIGLARLEQVLGLARPQLPLVDRMFRYANACAAANIPRWRASLQVDRFGTALHLLRRREEALLAGWDGSTPSTSSLAELAAAESVLNDGPGKDLNTEADRLRRIAQGMASGLRLKSPVTIEQADRWPTLWRTIASAVGAVSSSSSGTSAGTNGLGAWQKRLLGQTEPLRVDATLGFTAVSGRQSASQALAGLLGQATPERRASTVIICDDAELLAGLDDRLSRAGFPRLGAPPVGSSTALDGLLPLVIALCWDPVDPGLLMEFCLLPNGPIGRNAGDRLAAALASFPGLESRSWANAVVELTSPATDPDGAMAKRLSRWFATQRIPIGESAPADILAERCRVVAAWAGGRAATADDDASFSQLAGGASSLANLFAAAGGLIPAPAAARMLADALPGSAIRRYLGEAGSPFLVRQPWCIPENTQHAIWLSPLANDGKVPVWTAEELADLHRVGLPVDDGQIVAAARRDGDRQGLCRIRDTLLVVELPSSPDRRRHSAVLALHLGLKSAGIDSEHLPRLDDATLEQVVVAGWQRHCTATTVSSPQPVRLAWSVPSGGLRDREKHSFSELERRLACPLSWTLNYVAKLRLGGSVSLPEDHKLQGSFAHAVLETVFSNTIPSPADAAAAAARSFDDRLGRDASPLALPGRQMDRVHLRERVVETARLLAETLTRAGCTTVKMEAPISGVVGGRTLSGSIDCLANGPDLAVVIDLKLGGFNARRESLANGKAIQLAIYAATRSERTVAVAYGIINGKRLLTPAGAAIPNADGHGCEVVPDAPGWRDTWTKFTTALDGDQSWLTSGTVPARPLEAPASWPPGSDLVLDPAAEQQKSCEYCEFGTLCGRDRKT